MLTRLIMVIILQCIQILNLYIVHLKLILMDQLDLNKNKF